MEITVPLDSPPYERILDVDAYMDKHGTFVDGLSFDESDPVAPGERVPDSFFSEHEDCIMEAAEEKLIARHHEPRNPRGI